MASLMLSAAKAKPQVRLGHALSAFEKSLSDDRKAIFRTYRSQAAESQLSLEDVRRVVAEFDQSLGRPLGSRFINVLQAVQRFAVFGDVIVGGAGSIVPSSIWGCVRLTLTFVTDSVSLREKASDLFMDIGQTAPRHEQLSLLYPRSKRLQADLMEYFILLVQLCQRVFQSSGLARIAAHLKLALVDPELKNLKEQLDRWAISIDREVTLLIATRVEEEAREQSQLRALWAHVSETESKRRKMTTRLTWLDRCSEYDPAVEMKRNRKQGNTTYFMRDSGYQSWKDRTTSSTLLCRGTLGSGKSVLMANMVDDLVLSKAGDDCSISYFFISDAQESMQARTILGCLARQLLEVLPHQIWEGDPSEQKAVLDIEEVTELLCRMLPSKRRIVILLDALDQCPRHERIELFYQLKTLRKTFQVLVCGSLRVEANFQPEVDFQQLQPEFVFEIPLVNPEIAGFIESQLQFLLQSGELVVRDPSLVDEIRGCLVDGADGMFLWAALQLRTLCALEKSDKAIRQGLRDIPRGLPATYDQILTESERPNSHFQLRILKIITAASRPLTVDELRETLSVVPGEICWSEENLINDVYTTLSCCGSLLLIDEEELTVHLVHPSVRQFILGEMKSSLPFKRWQFTLQEAHAELAGIIITYVSIFETANQVTLHSSSSTTPKDVAPLLVPHPNQSLNAIFQPGTASTSLVKVVSKLNRLKYKHRDTAVDIRNTLGTIASSESGTDEAASGRDRALLEYAKSNWLAHSTTVSESDKKLFSLWKRLVEYGALPLTLHWSDAVLPVVLRTRGPEDFLWAIVHSHHPLLDIRLKKRKNKISTLSTCLYVISGSAHLMALDRRMATRLLTLALLLKEHSTLATHFLNMGPDPSYGNYGSLCAAVLSNNTEATAVLLSQITEPGVVLRLDFPLVAVAVRHSNIELVRLLIRAGADVEGHELLVTSLTFLSKGDTRQLNIAYAILRAWDSPTDEWDRCLVAVLARMISTSDPRYIRLAYLLLKKGASPQYCYGYTRAGASVVFREHINPELLDVEACLQPSMSSMLLYHVSNWSSFVLVFLVLGVYTRRTLAGLSVAAVPLVLSQVYAMKLSAEVRWLLYGLSVASPLTQVGGNMAMSNALDFSCLLLLLVFGISIYHTAPVKQPGGMEEQDAGKVMSVAELGRKV